ncbi:hypothetical protein ABZ318_22475 [Streptomyces sp. NPDC006197]|uniref:hypothetical protein n=1 Tax=Streptomyces sp. NPDC006197 TaxID=3156685 RepID=UPI0033B65D81
MPQTVLPAAGTLLAALRFWVGLAVMAVVKAPLVFHGRVRISAWAADTGLRVLPAPVVLVVSVLVVVTVHLTVVRRQIRGELLSRPGL